ncbi:GNAT family N-acetyltransferase [Chryseobacterium rhizosphaerae]|uniref:GNAT family N-acetyltransferase n=1 Tax=Chryseobacterium rhizosphaerae TaxID=395937 RepID=UPI002359F834|nr:GNAT family N-acetyltransferase [Chryseobacterium rhizosphaerae]MDC8100663.1 GNAT family N-acetyltransferase [Chryseobacterium rhizosphaerae]
MTIEYRKLHPAESKIYRLLRLESLEKFPESFGATYEEAQNTEKLRMEFDIENQTPERFVWGAFADAQLIGICVFVKDTGSSGNIYQMYVKEGFQGKNIGYELVEAVIHEARRLFHPIDIFLDVIPTNERAYYLYKKIGFKEVEKETDSNIVMKYHH